MSGAEEVTRAVSTKRLLGLTFFCSNGSMSTSGGPPGTIAMFTVVEELRMSCQPETLDSFMMSNVKTWSSPGSADADMVPAGILKTEFRDQGFTTMPDTDTIMMLGRTLFTNPEYSAWSPNSPSKSAAVA